MRPASSREAAVEEGLGELRRRLGASLNIDGDWLDFGDCFDVDGLDGAVDDCPLPGEETHLCRSGDASIGAA